MYISNCLQPLRHRADTLGAGILGGLGANLAPKSIRYRPKSNPNCFKIYPWDPGGVWGPTWPQEAPGPPQRGLRKLGSPPPWEN